MRFPGTKLDMGIVGSALAVCGMGFVCLRVLCVSLGVCPRASVADVPLSW